MRYGNGEREIVEGEWVGEICKGRYNSADRQAFPREGLFACAFLIQTQAPLGTDILDLHESTQLGIDDGDRVKNRFFDTASRGKILPARKKESSP